MNLEATEHQNRIFYSRTFPALVLLFLVSVLVRLPSLDRPLSKHHEQSTAIALRVLKTWDEQGASQFHWAPVMNFAGSTNKFINNQAAKNGRTIDEQGNHYYLAHPPLSLYLPHLFYQVTGLNVSPLSLQIQNLILNFVSALWVYFTVCLLGINRARSALYPPAVVAFLVYLFNPVTMWFQSNVYFADTVVHTFFILSVYATLKLIIRKRFYSFKYLLTFFAMLFCMNFTSWLGLYFSLIVIVYSLLRLKEEKGHYMLIILAVLALAIPFAITYVQYSQISGANAYLDELKVRMFQGSSLRNAHSGFTGFVYAKGLEIERLFTNYLMGYLPIYLLMIAFFWLFLFKSKLRIVFSENGFRFLMLSSLPVVLMHFCLLKYSSYDFTTLYASLFLSALVGILFDKVQKSGRVSTMQLRLGVMGILAMSVFMYYAINPPGQFSLQGKAYDFDKKLGQAIQHQANDATVFLSGRTANAQTVWYARKNLAPYINDQELRSLLKQQQSNEAKIFLVEPDSGLVEVRSVTLDNPSNQD